MKPDIVISWPTHLDYPLWREFIHENRNCFEKVIVILTQMNAGHDYRPWLQGALDKDGVISVTNDIVEGKDDWRNIAVNKGLSLSNAEWVWFTEQDFLPSKNLWEELQNAPVSDIYYASQDGRMHPCCIFIKRDVLNKTSRDFSANPPSHDHFGQLQKDLMNWDPPLVASVINPKLYTHMNGLSQNMYLLQIGQEPNYEPDKFKEYCQKCLQITLPIHPEVEALMENYLK